MNQRVNVFNSVLQRQSTLNPNINTRLQRRITEQEIQRQNETRRQELERESQLRRHQRNDRIREEQQRLLNMLELPQGQSMLQQRLMLEQGQELLPLSPEEEQRYHQIFLGRTRRMFERQEQENEREYERQRLRELAQMEMATHRRTHETLRRESPEMAAFAESITPPHDDEHEIRRLMGVIQRRERRERGRARRRNREPVEEENDRRVRRRQS